MGLGLLEDLTKALSITVDPDGRIRLTEAELTALRATLFGSGIILSLGPGPPLSFSGKPCRPRIRREPRSAQGMHRGRRRD